MAGIPVVFSSYSLIHYNEAENVVSDYNKLAQKAQEINEQLKPEYKDAFYQLVLYPVLASANLNELYVTAANRSYVTMSLKEDKNQLKNLKQLSSLRTHFKNFIAEITTDEVRIKQEKIQEFQEKAIQETAWVQFLFTLKFWLEDGSPNFEKTDIFIEKSVKLSFELMNVAPINSLIDFGKFIFKEKMQTN